MQNQIGATITAAVANWPILIALPTVAVALLTSAALARAHARLLLSRAKHPSLKGHPRIALRLARRLPHYEFSEDELFACDGAPGEIAMQRRRGFQELGRLLRERAPRTIGLSESIKQDVSD